MFICNPPLFHAIVVCVRVLAGNCFSWGGLGQLVLLHISRFFRAPPPFGICLAGGQSKTVCVVQEQAVQVANLKRSTVVQWHHCCR